MKREFIYYEYGLRFKEPLLICDNCGIFIEKPTVVGKNIKSKEWKKGAFQCGINNFGEIGTWCSEKCFEEN